MTTATVGHAGQRADALRALNCANEMRLQRAALRGRLRAGELSLADVLVPVHPLVKDVRLVDVVRWQYPSSAHTWREEMLGRRAVRHGVNLLMCVGRASLATREWVVEYGSNGRG